MLDHREAIVEPISRVSGLHSRPKLWTVQTGLNWDGNQLVSGWRNAWWLMSARQNTEWQCNHQVCVSLQHRGRQCNHQVCVSLQHRGRQCNHQVCVSLQHRGRQCNHQVCHYNTDNVTTRYLCHYNTEADIVTTRYVYHYNTKCWQCNHQVCVSLQHKVLTM